MKRLFPYLLVAIIGGLVSLLIYRAFTTTTVVHPVSGHDSVSVPSQLANYVPTAVPQLGPDFVRAAELTVNAVVHIKTEYTRKSSVYDLFFYDFFGDRRGNQSPRGNPIIATGSGVIISADGFIVTNNHVVQDAEKIEVTLNDRRTYTAKLIGNDPSTDLAVIKIESTELPYLNYGNSDEVRVGEWVLAVGNPFNLTSTVTAGIVSAKARNINILETPDGTAIESFIQTDAAVNRGNSGGALVNTRGELVGINAAIASGTGYYTGYSFAIPGNIVRKVVNDLINTGAVQRAFLGISIREVDAKLAADENLKEIKGVYVAGVTENSAAKEAGIKEGDVIIAIQGTHVNTTSELLEVIGQHRPGDKVVVEYRRKNKDNTVEVTLRNREGTTNVVKREERSMNELLGASFSEVPAETLNRLGISNGIQVTRLSDGVLKNAGVKEGFIIMKIDNKNVTSIVDLESVVKTKRGGVLIEGIYPNRMRAYYGFGL